MSFFGGAIKVAVYGDATGVRLYVPRIRADDADLSSSPSPSGAKAGLSTSSISGIFYSTSLTAGGSLVKHSSYLRDF